MEVKFRWRQNCIKNQLKFIFKILELNQFKNKYFHLIQIKVEYQSIKQINQTQSKRIDKQNSKPKKIEPLNQQIIQSINKLINYNYNSHKQSKNYISIFIQNQHAAFVQYLTYLFKYQAIIQLCQSVVLIINNLILVLFFFQKYQYQNIIKLTTTTIKMVINCVIDLQLSINFISKQPQSVIYIQFRSQLPSYSLSQYLFKKSKSLRI
ncbi:hypothetical protein ABPG72_009518 [Tetrahymena utriculariae]